MGSKAATGAIVTSTSPLQIGGDSIYGQFFSGVIDEVRVYNTALTQAQIQTDMTTPIGSGTLPPPNPFVNETLATGFDLPTAIDFLPDGRMLVVELQGTILVLPPPFTQPDPTPFLQLTNVGSAGVQQGVYDIRARPELQHQPLLLPLLHAGSPNHDRLSRFTANSALTGTISGSELVLYEDPQNANAEHHGGALNFGNDGKLYFTTGEHFDPAAAQDLGSPRGKILRINPGWLRFRRTVPSTTERGRTTMRSGRTGCATHTAPSTIPRQADSSSAMSAATSRRPRSRN